jgi:(1->4)-alpha-D-glucan 1-alpha-D-glucosylmutase
MRIPTATYRLQLNGDFGFEQAREAVPFLDALGITDLYASPIYQARSGSGHGYDVTDHESINSELGGEDGFRALARQLRAHRMGLLLDIVPNHMCVAGDTNRLWLDLLENGRSAASERFFDIDWNPPKPELVGRVLLPILPDQFGRVLLAQKLAVVYRPQGFAVTYGGSFLPLSPNSWHRIVGPSLDLLRSAEGPGHGDVLELESILMALGRLPPQVDISAAGIRERRHEVPIVTRRLAALHEKSAGFRSALDAALSRLAGEKDMGATFDALAQLLACQSFRLSSWRVAAHEINYRRFFDINDLAAIRVEDPKVFEVVHSLPFRLAKAGFVTGLRIDHVDGLHDPLGYLTELQRAWSVNMGNGPLPDAAYIVVEKILGSGEQLPSEWPVAGTTGYEFMSLVTRVLVDAHSEFQLRTLGAPGHTPARSFSDIGYECKKLILRTSLVAELTVLARRLDRISEQHLTTRDFTRFELQEVLAEVIACFPVYRTYVQPRQQTLNGADSDTIEAAVRCARRRNPVIHETVFDFVRSVLILEEPEGLTVEQCAERRDFVMRFQQLTGPVAAKGIEDTAFYRYFPLAALDEVGGDPEIAGASLRQFHDRMTERAGRAAHALSATDTHDAKRSEDVRARLAVLSEIPEEWDHAVDRWRALNTTLRAAPRGPLAPDDDDEYLFYQTVLGIWPPGEVAPSRSMTERVSAYMLKAVHEAKRHTSWINPNGPYDDAVASFVGAALDPQRSPTFLEDISTFEKRIERPGFWNGLAQVLIKIVAPGVPDFYQGSDLWSFHLVDPDNRNPIDFARRGGLLEPLLRGFERNPVGLCKELMSDPRDGRIKLLITAIGLRYRRANAALFQGAGYRGCLAQGPRSSQVIAFARASSEKAAIAVTGRFFTKFGNRADLPTGGCWAETMLVLPDALRGASLHDVFTGRPLRPDKNGALAVDHLLEHLPVALIDAQL